eukprot:jgi/Hompol1/526/HPOL_005346-RA
MLCSTRTSSRLSIKFVHAALSSHITLTRGIHVAVVGAGPAGFYAASRLLKDAAIQVDMYDRLPVPFGLVRYGVAPDHPDVKNVVQKFETVAQSSTFRFIGNATIGQDIRLSQLRAAYDAVILAYGSSSERRLGIEGSPAPQNVVSSRSFVGWYNGHPDHIHLNLNLESTDTAIIVGQGNVALDISRILLSPIDRLAKTDISRHALDQLASSRIRNVHTVGRRGPIHAAFTTKELREMLSLSDVTTQIDKAWLANQLAPYASVLKADRGRRRMMDLLLSAASATPESKVASKTWFLDFLLSPKRLLMDASGTRLCGVEFERNALTGDADLNQSVAGTGALEQISGGLLISSVGYRNEPLDGIPLDDKMGLIANVRGRVEGQEALYVSGWIKTGPRGVIASTMYDAFETAESLLEDLANGKLAKSDSVARTGLRGFDAVKDILESRGTRTTTFADWKRLDEIEKQRGIAAGKEREKIVSVTEMLELLH